MTIQQEAANLGKGIINDPKDFDVWDTEISDLFEGTDI